MDSDRSLAGISLDGPSEAQCLDGRSSPTLEQSSNRFSGNEITTSRLDSLESLIIMLGDAVIEEDDEYVSDYPLGLHKLLMPLILQRIIEPISESKWTAMQDYARAIEEINITNVRRHPTTVAETTYFRLAQLQGATPLFPRLDRLSILETPSTSQAISYSVLPMFLSPAFTSLSITGMGSSRRTSAVASFLGMLGPQSTLAHISLDYFSLSPAILKSIVGCGGLSRLAFTNVEGSIDQPSLHTLFSMPSLTNITFKTKKLEYLASEPVETLLPGSTQLSELHLAGPFPLLSEWIKFFSGKCDLQGLEMEIIITTNDTTGKTANTGGKQYPSSADIAALIKEAVPAWQHSLLTFEMKLDRPLDDGLPPTFLDAFSGFAFLEKLTLMNTSLHNINLAVQRNVAHWPSLTYLHLPRSHSFCTVSMESLHCLAENCPRLAFLRLLIQSPENDPFSDIASQGVHFPHVHLLSIGTFAAESDEPSVEQLCSIARNLLRVFPRLQTLETNKSFSENRWRNIKVLIDLCRDAEKYSKALSN